MYDDKICFIYYNKSMFDIFEDIYVWGISIYNIGLRFYKCSWFILYGYMKCVFLNLLNVNFILVWDFVFVMNKIGGF